MICGAGKTSVVKSRDCSSRGPGTHMVALYCLWLQSQGFDTPFSNTNTQKLNINNLKIWSLISRSLQSSEVSYVCMCMCPCPCLVTSKRQERDMVTSVVSRDKAKSKKLWSASSMKYRVCVCLQLSPQHSTVGTCVLPEKKYMERIKLRDKAWWKEER